MRITAFSPSSLITIPVSGIEGFMIKDKMKERHQPLDLRKRTAVNHKP
jgi:hypothetical protein